MKQRSLFVGGRSLVIGVGLFALSCGMSMAQFGGGGGGRGGMRGPATGIQMLRIPAVQTELKMTPDEISKIDAKQQEVRTGMQGLYQGGFAQMTSEERQQRADKVAELNDKAAADILDATQQKRFLELELQRQGPMAIMRKSVATQLALTDDQQKKLADIQTQADSDRRDAMQGMNFANMTADDRQKMMTKMQDLQKAQGDKILAVLTDAQKAQWKTMQGTPFTFPAPAGANGAAPAAAPAAKP